MVDQMERMSAFLGAHEQLLTEKQREVLNLYYKESLSFSKITENLHISRVTVNGHTKCGTHILAGYEEKLHLVQDYEMKSRIYGKMKTVGNDAIRELVKQLKDLE